MGINKKGEEKMRLGLFRKMRLLNVIVCLAFCLNMGFSGSALAYGTMLKPPSAVQKQGVVAAIGGNNPAVVKLTNTAAKLNLAPQTVSDFQAIEKKIAEPVLTPLQKFVESINNASSKKKAAVFGSNLPPGTIEVSVSQLQGFAGVLAQHGLKTKGMKVTRLQGNLAPEQLLKEDGINPILEISISQAFGSRLFVGGGKEVKETADANAVHFSDASIRNVVKTNPKVAVVILGDEGSRDRSVSLAVGSIYYSGYGDDVLKKFETIEESNNEIQRLIEKGIILRFFVGDALEVTNGLIDAAAVSEPTSSWSLAALFNELNPWVNDSGRVGGVSYRAPRDAGVDPFDLPSVALPKIAKARGVNIEDEAELAKFMNKTIVLTLGPRKLKKDYEVTEKHRHQAIIDDANGLKKKYPGLKVVIPGDGDCMPRVVSSLGLDLGDGYNMVTFGRSGANEANAALLVAKNAAEGQFDNTYVSEKATSDNYSADVAYNFNDKEVAAYKKLGVPESVYRGVKRTKDAVNGNGLLAMTSVTGASAEIFGKNFADLLQRVKFNPTADKKGEATTSTFVVVPDGSIFVVTTQFETADLAQTQRSIKSASKEAKKYLAAKPIKAGNARAFYDKVAKQGNVIVMSTNTRSKYVIEGIFRGAKETNAPVVIQRSISEFVKGYTPADLARDAQAAADKVGYTGDWLLKLDHGTIGEDTEEAIQKVIKYVNDAKAAGFASFSIDASKLVDFKKPTVAEQQKRNIEVTARIVKETGVENFAWEAEIGEIVGEHNALSTVEEAITFIEGIEKLGVRIPVFLAINNGSEHGNVPGMKINLERTKAIADALYERWGNVIWINQHGITGTELSLFPQLAAIRIKNGNVGTHWQNYMWDVINKMQPEIVAKAIEVLKLDKYRSKNWDKQIRNFEPQLAGLLTEETKAAITEAVRKTAVEHYTAFASKSPSLVVEPIFNRAVIVDPALLPAGGVTEILKAFAQLNDAYIVFYGPGAEEMRILSGEGENSVIAASLSEVVTNLKKMGIAPANIELVTTAFKEELKDTGINQKIVPLDTVNVLLGLTKAITEISNNPEARAAFTKLYDDVEKVGAIPKDETAKAELLTQATIGEVETIKIKSIGMVKERTEEQKKIIEEVAAKLGV